jgi:hypothetical protein
MDVDLKVDTETYTETSGEMSTKRGSQLIGAAVGAASFGTAGALVGGLSATQTVNSTTISDTFEVELVLRSRLLDRKHPIVETEFYKMRKGQAINLPVRKALALRFHAHLSNILHENRTSGANAASD